MAQMELKVHRKIPVAAPILAGNEKTYVLDCLENNWISSVGPYVERFEAAFARFCKVKHAIACCNGTAALHVALLSAGIGPGDEVIVPSLSFIATANAVSYCGATPVPVDSGPRSWNIAPERIAECVTSRTRAIIPVHLYGLPADMSAIRELAEDKGITVIEDAAEAHGAMYRGHRVGSLGKLAVFSFYGNKILTTGEGGMVVTDDDLLADRARRLKGQGLDPDRRYWFPVIGYNYRMSNIAAAIGLGQLEQIEWHLKRHSEIASRYRQELADIPRLETQVVPDDTTHAWWMFTVLLPPEIQGLRDSILQDLANKGIETRPIFHPVHAQPPYRAASQSRTFAVADQISARGLSLPTWSGLAEEDVSYVSGHFRQILQKHFKSIKPAVAVSSL